MTELRTALNLARSSIGLPAITYSYSITLGTPVRKVDLTEIRNGVK